MSMPLFGYFTSVGAGLLGLLLLINFMVEPSEPKPEPAAAAIEQFFAKSPTTPGSAQLNGTYRSTVASEREPEPSGPASSQPAEQSKPLRTGEAEQGTATPAKPKRKTAITRVSPRRYEASAYSSYARVPSYYSAESRHAPQ